MAEPTTIVTVTESRTSELVEFYRTILLPSFRPDELITEHELLDGHRTQRAHTLLALDPTGAVVGGITSEWYPFARVLLVSYLAVHLTQRGGGTGGQLYRAGLDRWTRELSPQLVLGEVEDLSNGSSPAYGDPAARLRFYDRFNVRALDIPYFQPALRPGARRVFDLLLMVFAAEPGAHRAPDRIKGASVERFILDYVRGCEGSIRSDDHQLHRLIECCRQPEGIALRDIASLGAWHHVGELPESG